MGKRSLLLALALASCTARGNADLSDPAPAVIPSATDNPVVASSSAWPPMREPPPLPPPHPDAPPGAWNDRPGPRTDIEQKLQDSGAWLIIRSGPGLPGWWYGPNEPVLPCIQGSLFSRTGPLAQLYFCEGRWWRAAQ